MAFQLTCKSIQQEAPKKPTIAFYVPTRGREKLCISAMNSWKEQAADPDSVKFLIGVDNDDDKGFEILSQDFPVHRFTPDVISCGGRVQQLSAQIDADFYLASVDYYFCNTLHWDDRLRQAMHHKECLNFACAHDINSYNFTCISKKLHGHLNPVEPTWFPFWFSDQWRGEMVAYIFDNPPQPCLDVVCAGRKSTTQNLHDLDFWWGFFHALRPLRLKQAHQIAKAYGLAGDDLTAFMASRKRQVDAFTEINHKIRNGLKANEQKFSATKAKSEKYLTAKANAEAYIADNKLTLWEMNNN